MKISISPEDYPVLLEPLITGKADAVFGSRFMGGDHVAFFFWHMAGNKFLTLLSNMFTSLNLTDMETGYKAFKASAMKSIQIEEHRFGVEPEIAAKLARTAVSHQQQRDVARPAAGLQARENRAQLFRHARAAVPALVRLMLTLARAPASVAHAD
jgi:hypothetical protein